MLKRLIPLAVVLLAWTATSFAAGAAPAKSGSTQNADVSCRLQDNAECLKVLEVRAGTPEHMRSASRELYAVLVNGDTSALHNGNVERAYEVLRTLGVPDSNLYVLSNSNPRPNARQTGPALVTARATTNNVANVLAYIAGEIDDNDCLLVYTTGHGVRQAGQSAVVLNDGTMLETDMVKELKRMGGALSVLVMDQCFSGGFADAVQKAGLNTVAITSTDSKHETYCEYFAGGFWLSLLEPEADINSDGRVSLEEAYQVATTLHRMALADTPERTHCRFVEPEGQTEPSVVLSRHAFSWDAQEPAPQNRPLITASADDEQPQRPQLRRNRLAGHQKGYRPGE
jgi:hypothetical protein